MQAAMGGNSRVLLAIAALMLLCLLRKANTQSDPVVVSLQPDNINVFRGESVWFYCHCSLWPTPATMIWLRDGVELDNQSFCGVFIYRLRNIDYEDQGEYSCRVELDNGTIIGPIVAAGGRPLNVVDPTQIQAEPQQYGLLHSNVVLSCRTNFTDISVIHIRWKRNSTRLNSNQITNANLSHEGNYVCEVYLGDVNLLMQKYVTFYVIVPPTIISQPLAFHEIRGNRPFSLTVEFQSRFRENTTVVWYKDGSRLPERRVQIEYTSEVDGQTTISFVPISRSDSGVYRVAIENSFEMIPQLLRTNETSFTVSVVVPPSIPANVRALDILSNQAQITWSPTNQHPDQEAETLTLTMEFLNGTLAEQYSLAGDVTQQRVTTVPGMEYRVTLTASNQDGTGTADPASFQTPAGAPSSPTLEVTRVSNTTFNLLVSLAYTGGGAITHIIVSFRNNGTTAWIPLGQIPASPSPESSLVWSGVVSRDEFAGMTVQFEVAVVNAMLYQSTAVVAQEAMVLSGAPTPSLLSSTSCAVTVEVQLSPDGTPPILAILFNFTSPPGLPTRRLTGPFFPGDTIKETLSGLEGSTEYRLTTSAVNVAGIGPTSDEMIFTTDIAIWIIVLIAVVSIIVIVSVAVVVMVTYHCCKVHRRKQEYYINPVTSADEKHLDPTHEMVTRQSNPLLSQLSRTSLTPRSPTTPPVPTPPRPADSPANLKFKFETGSSNGSTNNDTDESEANCPRYTYAVSPSPGDSLHSLQTKTTSLHSTRESLIYPPASSNATDV